LVYQTPTLVEKERMRTGIGILIYCQNAVVWYSKRQDTVESSSFGSSKFIEFRIAKEMIVALWLIQATNVWSPHLWAGNVFCDNNEVIKNASIPQSMFPKKHNAIDCHANHQAVAAGIIQVGKEDGMTLPIIDGGSLTGLMAEHNVLRTCWPCPRYMGTYWTDQQSKIIVVCGSNRFFLG
jgi:hypothetical protein